MPTLSALPAHQTCLPFSRSSPYCEEATRSDRGNTLFQFDRREQFNAITAFIDGSQIYGSDQTTADLLREFVGGQLATGTEQEELLPEIAGSRLAGDVRAEEQPGLLALHTLWLREHNRVVADLASASRSLPTKDIQANGELLDHKICSGKRTV